MPTTLDRVTIVGSGLAGSLMAARLGLAGVAVDLHEKRADPRRSGADRGRSINLALSIRGIHALEEVGVAQAVLDHAVAMPGRMIHDPTGRLTFQPYGKDASHAIHSVSRSGLNMALLDLLDRLPDVRVAFSHRCTGVDVASNTLHFHDDAEGRVLDIPCSTIIGADGAFSAVRASLQRQENFDFSQEYLSHGYKELTIPAERGGRFRMEKHALHIWPRRSYMLIALPNADGSFTCTLFFPHEGATSFAALKTPEDVQSFFDREFPDAAALMPDLKHEFFANPTGPLVTIRCRPWHHADRIVLLGDACHAVVPFLGQGMNAAFEDCSTLFECLTRHSDRFSAFRAYEQARKEHTDVLADLAVKNFIEMRDHTGSRLFLLRKKWQILLHKLFGERYVPLYTLVSFTRTPYADAVRRARKQDRVVRVVLLGLLILILLLCLVPTWL